MNTILTLVLGFLLLPPFRFVNVPFSFLYCLLINIGTIDVDCVALHVQLNQRTY